MSRYIDADNLHNAKFQDISGYGENVAYRVGWNDAIDAICENAPSIDIEPKQGKWIDAEIRHEDGVLPIQVCSECKTFYPLEYTGGGHHFCPNCGASMREREGE